MKRKMIVVVAGVGLLVLGWHYWLVISNDRAMVHAGGLPFSVSKETTAITSPLRPDGRPDYVAALNEKYGKGVMPENNGFVVWLKAVGTGENVLDPKIKDKVLKMCGAEETPAGAELWEGYSAYLKRTKVTRKRGYWMPAGSWAGGELWTAADRRQWVLNGPGELRGWRAGKPRMGDVGVAGLFWEEPHG